MSRHSNHLIHETSPYLLQHAHNPVDWYPWGDVALQKAKEENKPILVSIGYSACHWCHVMERESFENEDTAAIMNQDFINIKIDREERPDLDQIYMDAVQAMAGSGGWPLNVFLTPEGKPFYGGTYFPPRKAYNRPSWTDVLNGVSQAFRERRHEIDAQAENLTNHLRESNSFGVHKSSGENIFDWEKLKEASQNLLKTADTEWGGFGKAPKFPQTFSILFLLRFASPPTPLMLERGRVGGETQALLSLDKMIQGGIYDQLGGGFARYSTDTEWLAPHFEKMLYDNALILSVLAEAYQLTRKERYKEVIEESMEFIIRELTHPSNGFYAALDADSEGEEGKFYVWSYTEVKEILDKDTGLFCEFYDITEKGNWSEAGHDKKKNILRVKKPLEEFANENNISIVELKKILHEGKKKLLKKREERIRPGLDDKIILGWNALMNSAISKAFAATGKEEYRQLAIGNMQFLLKNFSVNGSTVFFHTWKNEKAKYPAFLDDYAFLIRALMDLQEITGNAEWLEKAASLCQQVIDQFSEDDGAFFFYTPATQTDVIIRKKEIYDGALPSGNSVMASNLHHLSILLDKPEWKERTETMLTALGDIIIRYPGSFGNWASLLLEKLAGTHEIVIVGEGFESLHTELLGNYIPHRIIMISVKPNQSYALLADKHVKGPASIWLCRNNTCELPVFSVKDLISLINRVPGPN